MSEQTTTTASLSPREAEALTHYDAWKGNGSQGSYAEYVAERMLKGNGQNITVGRAGVYVREALSKSGRSAEIGTGRGSGGGRKPAKLAAPDAMLNAALAQYDAAIERLRERQEEADKPLADFDPDAFTAEREEALTQAVKQAQAALKAWKADADVRKQAADAERERLRQRAETVRSETQAALEEAETNREALASMIDKALSA